MPGRKKIHGPMVKDYSFETIVYHFFAGRINPAGNFVNLPGCGFHKLGRKVANFTQTRAKKLIAESPKENSTSSFIKLF